MLGETGWGIYGNSLCWFLFFFLQLFWTSEISWDHLMTPQKPFWQFSEHPRQNVNELSQDSQSNCKIHPGFWCKGCLSKKGDPRDPKTTYWPCQFADSPAIGNHSALCTSMANTDELNVSLETMWALSLLNAGRVSQIAPEILSNKSIFLILVTFLLILLTQLQEQNNQNSAMIKSVLTSWLQLCPPCNFFVTVSVLIFNGWRAHVIT